MSHIDEYNNKALAVKARLDELNQLPLPELITSMPEAAALSSIIGEVQQQVEEASQRAQSFVVRMQPIKIPMDDSKELHHRFSIEVDGLRKMKNEKAPIADGMIDTAIQVVAEKYEEATGAYINLEEFR